MKGTPRRLAVIDIGTNSVRLLAVSFEADRIDILEDSGEVTRLGAGLGRSGRIEEADAEVTGKALETCLSRARAAGAQEIEIAGTEVFRSASNGREMAERFSARIGHVVQILSREQEAEAAYLGVIGWQESPWPEPQVIMDVGGGSTELVVGEGIALQAVESLPLGALTLTETHFSSDPPGAAELEEARRTIDRRLSSVVSIFSLAQKRGPTPVGVGGSACAIGAWLKKTMPYDPVEVHGAFVSRADLDGLLLEWSGMSSADRMKKGGMSLGRARVVLGGGLIISRVLSSLGAGGFRVSVHGLRHGLILKRMVLD